jgi:hypothetical protein
MADQTTTPLATRQRLTVVFCFDENKDKRGCNIIVYPVPRAEFIGLILSNDDVPTPIPREQIPADLLKLTEIKTRGIVSTIIQAVAVGGYDILLCNKREDGLLLH